MTPTSLAILLSFCLGADVPKSPSGGPVAGVAFAMTARRFEPTSWGLCGSRCCQDGDHWWLLFTARTPTERFEDSLPWSWVAEIDQKGMLVGAPRRILPPSDLVYDVSDLAAVSLGCVVHRGKLVSLNPDGAVIEISLRGGREESTVACRVVNSLSPDKLGARFCNKIKRVAFLAFRIDNESDPEIYLEIEPMDGRRRYVRTSLNWAELLRGSYAPRKGKVPVGDYCGDSTNRQAVSAVYLANTNEISLIDRNDAELVRWVSLMENEHHDSLKNGLASFMKEERHWGQVFNFRKEPLEARLAIETSHYGKIDQDDRCALGLSGLVKVRAINGKSHFTYLEMNEGKLFVRQYDKKIGKAIAVPSSARVNDYEIVSLGRQLIAFAVEIEGDERGGRKLGDKTRFFFRSYRFDGAAWKQLPDWCDSQSQRLTRVGDKPEAFGLIPVFRPMVIGGEVFVYYVGKECASAIPKVNRFQLRPIDLREP